MFTHEFAAVASAYATLALHSGPFQAHASSASHDVTFVRTPHTREKRSSYSTMSRPTVPGRPNISDPANSRWSDTLH